MESVDFIWTLVSFIFTLLIFSYVLGDNPLFKIATYIFTGVAAAYISVMIIYQVLLPKLIFPLAIGGGKDKLLALVPLSLSLLLIFKLFPRFSRLGNLSMGYLVGIGAGVLIGGVVTGTIFSQIGSTINLFDLQSAAAQNTSDPMLLFVEGLFVLAGTVSTLAYFHFGARSKDGQTHQRFMLIEGLAAIGKIFVAITLGALFAGVYTAAITALIERLDFILTFIFNSLF